MKVDLQTKFTVTVIIVDPLIFIIMFISQKTISNNFHVRMNIIGRCNHEVTVSVILASDLECIYFLLFHSKTRIYGRNISTGIKKIFLIVKIYIS